MSEQSSGDDAGLARLPNVEEQRIRLAARAAGIGVWEWPNDSEELIYDNQAREICGFPPDGPVTLDMARAITHPDDLPGTSEQARRARDPSIRDDSPYRYRIYRANDGEMRWILAHGEAVFQQLDGVVTVLRYLGTMQDVTAEKQAQDQIVESEARMRLAMEVGDLALWDLNTGTGEAPVSPELNRIFGFPADARPSLEELGNRYAEGEQERLARIGAEAREKGETKMSTEIKLVWPDGSEHWAWLNAQLSPISEGANQRVIGTMIDITERKRAEEQLTLFAREMRHRVKNTLAIVQAIANQSLRQPDIKSARAELSGRLAALSTSTDLMFAKPGEGIALAQLVADITAPFRPGTSGQFKTSGPAVVLPEQAVSPLGLMVHELCTNAAKYGALSTPEGMISLTWKKDGGDLEIRWVEAGGPHVEAPETEGFGGRLIQSLTQSLDGEVNIEYDPDGIELTLVVPLSI